MRSSAFGWLAHSDKRSLIRKETRAKIIPDFAEESSCAQDENYVLRISKRFIDARR